ncbi:MULTISPECIES: hypothetical protein [Cryobacterium]|uniref:DUF5667 domain-containing protein n=1 Tax=Cryobacterium glucosi TaxID=1259175 RepID=A0ABY2ITP1_9MICO|nr:MULTISPECIES: hypothetical protein [Cryobacterium]TFB99722.1 hypothetical protein E3O39_02985 [Cryobacterium sp. MDB2-A-1]TFC09705.1 hypothetical protein E3O35_14175 [Cryobacterium sp. MDB2-A-2]TFC22669.1 hypothetical protein E3O46_04325 [Cryobacterium glucosi]TFC23963.1 hypothetical protein E3O51_00110 [Cryobacterium sp. MDB2-10]
MGDSIFREFERTGRLGLSAQRLRDRFRALPKTARIGLAAGLAALLITGATAGGFGVVTAANAATHASAFTANTEAVTALTDARTRDAAASKTLVDDLVAGTTLSTKVTALVGAAAGLADPGAQAALEAARKSLGDTVASIAADRHLDLATGLSLTNAIAATTVTGISANAETDAITAATSSITKLTADTTGSARGNAYLAATLDKVTKAVTAAFTPVVNSVPASGQARLDATPSAGAPERDALTAAIAAVKDDGTILDTLWAYTQAASAATTSHNAVEAQKAAEAAAAAAAQAAAAQAAADAAAKSSSSFGSSSTSGSGSKLSGGTRPSSGSVSSSVLGGSSSGGSSSSGGNSVGGPSGADSSSSNSAASPWWPLQIHAGSSDCQGAGGGQQVSYGSTLNPPSTAFSVTTYEIPGYGWGVTWTCDTGW